MTRILLTSLLASVLGLFSCLAPGTARAAAPVRLSVKFILDAAGNRGTAGGNLVTNQDVQDQVDRANEILALLDSEFGVDLLEIVDIADPDGHHASDIRDELDDILLSAIILPGTYRWRTDAINLYITGDSRSGVTYTPPNNGIIVMGQGANATTLAHEIGHDLNLEHTFDGDGCADTIADRNPQTQPGGWSQDDIANENFGMTYAGLGASQQRQVDDVWNNVMSYHDSNDRDFVSACQMNRNSDSAWDDRNWMLTRLPLYVDPNAGTGGNSGSWGNPFANLDEAIASGSLSGRALVLLPGAHSMSYPLSADDLEVIARRAPATIHEDIAIWDDPVDPGRSQVPAVAEAMRDLQAADRAGDAEAALEALRRGERHATGEERIIVRLKLAQRLRHAGLLAESLERYRLVADETDDPKLRGFARHWAGRVEEAQKASRDERETPGGSRREPGNAPVFAASGPQEPGPSPELTDAPSLDEPVGADPLVPRDIEAPLRAAATHPTGPGATASERKSQTAAAVEARVASASDASRRPWSMRSRPHTARDKAVLAGAFLLGAAFLGTAFARQRSRRS